VYRAAKKKIGRSGRARARGGGGRGGVPGRSRIPPSNQQTKNKQFVRQLLQRDGVRVVAAVRQRGPELDALAAAPPNKDRLLITPLSDVGDQDAVKAWAYGWSTTSTRHGSDTHVAATFEVVGIGGGGGDGGDEPAASGAGGEQWQQHHHQNHDLSTAEWALAEAELAVLAAADEGAAAAAAADADRASSAAALASDRAVDRGPRRGGSQAQQRRRGGRRRGRAAVRPLRGRWRDPARWPVEGMGMGAARWRNWRRWWGGWGTTTTGEDVQVATGAAAAVASARSHLRRPLAKDPAE
jgi:hypothetical protein